MKKRKGEPTSKELAMVRDVLDRLVEHGDLDGSEIRRLQDGMRVVEDAFWRIEEPQPRERRRSK